MYLYINPTNLQHTVVRLLTGPFSVEKELIQEPPRCDELLQLVVKSLGKRRPDGILIAMGQGSFTGVRCGVTIGNALAWAWGLPIFGLDITKFRNEKALIERGVKHLDLLIKKSHPQRLLHVIYGAEPNITKPKQVGFAGSQVFRKGMNKKFKKMRVVQEISAGGVTIHKGKVLVIRFEDSRQWVFPKGHIDPGENAETATAREVHEETGFRVRVGESLGIEHYAYRHPDGAEIQKKVYYFKCNLISERPQPIVADPDEHFIVEWMPILEAQKKLAYSSLRELLRKALVADKSRSLGKLGYSTVATVLK